MQFLYNILPYAQVVVAVLLIVSILLQSSSAGLGGAFGADNFSSIYHTRRGAEKFLFQATIVLAVIFVLISVLNVLK